MKKSVLFTAILLAVAMLTSCAKTELSFRNDNTSSTDADALGNITWQKDSVKYNEVTNTNSVQSGLKSGNTSDSKEVTSTSSTVSADVYDPIDTIPWASGSSNNDSFSITDKESNTVGISFSRR